MEDHAPKPLGLQRAWVGAKGVGMEKTNTTCNFVIVNDRTKISYFLLVYKIQKFYMC